MKTLSIGIDATNIRHGGGRTHLVELLQAAQPEAEGIFRVVVWASQETLDLLEDRAWLQKRCPRMLNAGLLRRSLWQRFYLSKEARRESCDVLFVPGGSFLGGFQPVVTMSQNLLPFEIRELRRYGWTLFSLKLLLLRWTHSHSFQNSAGVIFLTQYARDVVTGVTKRLLGKNCIIPHGLNDRFYRQPKFQLGIENYDLKNPYRILYVSIIDHYKHQWVAVESVAALRMEGFPVELDLVGPAYPPALERLNAAISRFCKDTSWVHYHGAIPFDDLHLRYAEADLGLFASSCENMPNILLETMASGLPIACSNRGAMPEVLGSAGVYFDPEQPEDLARALRELIASPNLRAQLAQMSYKRVQQFSWARCAAETFRFLAAVSEFKVAENV